MDLVVQTGKAPNIFKNTVITPRTVVTQEEARLVNASPNYVCKAREIGELVQSKNLEYGDAINNVDDILKILYPQGIDTSKMKDASVIIRVIDKLFRIANGNKGSENAWNDIAGYGILMSSDEKR